MEKGHVEKLLQPELLVLALDHVITSVTMSSVWCNLKIWLTDSRSAFLLVMAFVELC